MKFKFGSFLSGILCATLAFSLALSALAISGRMTIEVDPINVQVNGEVFQPTDVNGKEVPVFAYQGTTYAPLRALAEAYGLEVGYNAAENMATVIDPDVQTPDTTAKTDYSDWSAEDEAAYQEFKGMWEVEQRFSGWSDAYGMYAESYKCTYNGKLGDHELKNKLENTIDDANARGFLKRMGGELEKDYPCITLWFYVQKDADFIGWYDWD